MKKNKRLMRISLIVVVLVLIAIATFFYIESLSYETTDDAFIKGQVVYIAPQVSGTVNKLYIKSNQLVKKGDLLLEIDQRPFELEVKEAQAALEIAKSKLDVAKSEYEIAIDAQNTMAIDMYRNQLLSTGNAVAVEDFEHTIALYQGAKSAVKSKQASINLAKSNIDKAIADLNEAKLTLSYTKIYAPESGVIAKKNFETGSLVSTGSPLMAIVLRDKWVEANLKENQLDEIRVGQKVDIYIDAYPDKLFKGKVESIQPGTGAAFSLLPPENATGNFVKTVQRVPIKITFDRQPYKDKYFLAIGMSVEPTVYLSN